MTLICFLAISAQFTSVLASIPRLDGSIWLINYLMISQGFVFYSILEFAVVNFFSRIETRIEKARGAAVGMVEDEGCDEQDSPGPRWATPRKERETRIRD